MFSSAEFRTEALPGVSQALAIRLVLWIAPLFMAVGAGLRLTCHDSLVMVGSRAFAVKTTISQEEQVGCHRNKSGGSPKASTPFLSNAT
jgi:hypothetical protein